MRDYETEHQCAFCAACFAFMCATLVMTFAGIAIFGPEHRDTGFRVPVERLSDEEANAYYDGRKLVNDNQRAWVDKLAEENK